MRWKFNEFIFDTKTRLLLSNNKEQLLEPKTAQLLNYLCQNAQQDVSRDQLIDAVWQNQVVTDNAINRVIGLLRKALGDEAKVKRFIVTVPKVGYQFIANPTIIDNTAVTQSANVTSNNNSSPSFRNLILVITIFILILGVAIISTIGQRPQTIATANITPITRLANNQFDAQYATDADRYVYSSKFKQHRRLFLANSPREKIQIISQEGGHATLGRWSKKDEFIIYLFRNKTQCEIHQVDFINQQPQLPRVIYQCPLNSIKDIAIGHNNTLFFTKRDSQFSPYNIQELNIVTGHIKRVNQPHATGKGNHHLDLSDDGKRLLILSDERPGTTSFYQLELQTNKLSLLTTLEYFVNKAIWAHQPNAIVHQGPHPSSQLLITDLDNGQTINLLSDSRRIGDITRINNEKDYAFSSYLFNNDIVINKKEPNLLNSSVTDFLPTLNHSGEYLAFVSKRSGKSDIWIADLTTQQIIAIPTPLIGRRYLSLSWSPTNKYLLANTSNELLVIEASKQTIIQTIPLVLPAYNATWTVEGQISYSQFIHERWQLFHHTLSQKSAQKGNKKWAFSLSSTEKTLFFDHDYNAFTSQGSAVPTSLCRFEIIRRKLTAQFNGSDLYCRSRDKNNELIRVAGLKIVQRHVHKIASMGFVDFSVAKDTQAITKLKSSTSDIMRTNFSSQ